MTKQDKIRALWEYVGTKHVEPNLVLKIEDKVLPFERDCIGVKLESDGFITYYGYNECKCSAQPHNEIHGTLSEVETNKVLDLMLERFIKVAKHLEFHNLINEKEDYQKRLANQRLNIRLGFDV